MLGTKELFGNGKRHDRWPPVRCTVYVRFNVHIQKYKEIWVLGFLNSFLLV